LNLAEVEPTGEPRLDHYMLRLSPTCSARPPVVLAAVPTPVTALLSWRHRFIPDARGLGERAAVVTA
jgi:hypothetical protein